ncbi:MAG TPA: adenylyltransferase/cytidyltransferase family protein [Candidatus Saccharimonadales bacterium]
MRRIGIYAGTFDPPHDGHVAFAKASLHEAQLAEVIFMPEKIPRYKQNVSIYSERHKQIKSKISDIKGLSLLESPLETFDSASAIPWLTDLYPEDSFTFLFGSDIVANMKTWNDIHLMFKNTSLVIGLRDGQEKETIITELTQLQKMSGVEFHFDLIKTDYSHLSSSMFR